MLVPFLMSVTFVSNPFLLCLSTLFGVSSKIYLWHFLMTNMMIIMTIMVMRLAKMVLMITLMISQRWTISHDTALGSVCHTHKLIRIINASEVGILYQTTCYPPSLQCCTWRVWSNLGLSPNISPTISDICHRRHRRCLCSFTVCCLTLIFTFPPPPSSSHLQALLSIQCAFEQRLFCIFWDLTKSTSHNALSP